MQKPFDGKKPAAKPVRIEKCFGADKHLRWPTIESTMTGNVECGEGR